MLLFAEASIDQAFIIDTVLESYCQSSEARVNKSKTKVFFSKNVVARDAKNIGEALGFMTTKDLGNYLGMPLLHSRVTKATYQTILDKVDTRLTGWSAKHLSFAGRVTLTQSVLQALPVFAMQTTLLLSSVCNRIDQACRRFIWDGSSKTHRMHMVGWNIMCTDKKQGGLGFKNLDRMNYALLMKLSWGIISKSDKLWVRVLCSKYGVDSNNPPTSLPDKNGSRIWKAIRTVWDVTMQGTRWSVGNGDSVWFWLDCWVTHNDPLISFAFQQPSNESVNATVSDFVTENGDWRWMSFEHLLPGSILMKIASILPPASRLGPDRMYWGLNPKGIFTVRSAYDFLSHHTHACIDQVWQLPWAWKGPHSIRLFIWQLLHGKLKTNSELSRRHIPISDVCIRCGGSTEDILHAIRDCSFIKKIWVRLVPTCHNSRFFQSNLREWIFCNLQNKWSIDVDPPWECIFGVTIWRLWFWRNHFNANGQLVDSTTVCLDALARAKEIHRINNSPLSQQQKRMEIYIGWRPPPWPWCKLNTDGSCKSIGVAGAGGIIRGASGNWISGFCMKIGEASVIMAKLWGLHQGLILAWNTGIRRLLVEVDSLSVTQMVTKQVVVPNVFHALVVAIQELLHRSWQITITHIYREGNSTADFMANMAHSFSYGLHLFSYPPEGIRSILLHDMFGTFQPRLVPG